MSVWQIRTIVVLMHFVITPTDPLIAHVNLDIKEMEKTAQVIFIWMCGLISAWHQKLLCRFVCVIYSLFFP